MQPDDDDADVDDEDDDGDEDDELHQPQRRLVSIGVDLRHAQQRIMHFNKILMQHVCVSRCFTLAKLYFLTIAPSNSEG